MTQILVLCSLDLSQVTSWDCLHLVAEAQLHWQRPQVCCPLIHLFPPAWQASPGLEVMLGHLSQLPLIVKGQEPHPVAGSV